jgi:hypothetical protein
MVSTDKAVGAVNAVFMGAGNFKVDRSGNAAISLTMVYTNSKRDDLYGSCSITGDILSKKTMDAFKEFANLAEADFGSTIFDNVNAESAASPEQDTGLPKGLGGL